MDDYPTARSPRIRTGSCWLAALTLFVCSAAATADDLDPELHILLTNDDGYQAPGIVTLHEALREAGFRVSVAAPLNQQSGSSMRVTMGEITVKEVDDGFWTIDGTPADSVSWALNTVLRNDLPDLVVSGSNFGQNLGGNTNLSGTVGAAIMATQLGVPAIAVSVGIDLAERNTEPKRFPSTADAFPRAAVFTVALIRELVRSAGGGPLLPPHRILNVNYPALPASAIRGVRMAPVAHAGGFDARFVDSTADGKVRIDLEHGQPLDPDVAGGDTELFAAGYITISMLDGSLDAGRDAAAALGHRFGPMIERFGAKTGAASLAREPAVTVQ